MRRWWMTMAVAGALAITPALANADEVEVQCEDGSLSTGGRGACSHHGGVAHGVTRAAPPPSGGSLAPPAASAPAATPVRCGDGTLSASVGRGACSHHGGVGGPMAPAAPAAPAPRAQTPSVPTAPAASSAPAQRAPSAPSTPTASPATTPRAQAQTPAPTPTPPNAPGQPTARCKDGTMSFAKHHSGACSHHGGVAQWM